MKKWKFIPDLDKLYSGGKNVFPKKEDIFNFYIPNPRVIILGQDPYYKYGKATGLAFAVPNNEKKPPSLINIFKELKNDLGIERTDSTLLDWKEQGILLLNTSLTVEENKPGSHKKIWKKFMENYISELGKDPNLIWVLWGNYAKEYKHSINGKIIESSHPSPLSSHRGFFGSKPFSKINNILEQEICVKKISF